MRARLPSVATMLLGREREMEQIGLRLLEPGTRLVTLTGPGGTGKTRLALAVAAAVSDHFRDGATFVDLSPITRSELVVAAIADARGIRESGGQGIAATLRSVLAGDECLLVLDNMEQVLGAAQDISGLLAACPGVTVLATSREPLGISWEQQMPVGPLAVPGSTSDEPGVLELAPAVRLFLDRAGAVAPTFALSDKNAHAVAELCRRLDGLPLAIELAAARVKMFPPAVILARLDKRMDFLARRAPDAPARHQTLRDTVAWSYNLLTSDEQTLFRRLGVFAGGFGIEGAEAVVDDDAVVDRLGSLCDKSLVRAEPTDRDEARFSLSETIRAFALEQLASAGELEPTRDVHARYCLDLALRAEAELSGPDQRRWNLRLGTDLDNLRAAVTWWIERGQLTAASDLMWHVRLFYWTQGHLADVRRFSGHLLELGQKRGLDARSEGRVLFGTGFAAFIAGDYPAGVSLLERAVETARRVGDPQLLGQALMNFGFTTPLRGESALAGSLFAEAADAFRKAGDDWGEAMTYMARGEFALLEGDVADGAAWTRQFLESARARGDVRSLAQGLLTLGSLALAEHDYERAAALFEESLQHAREAPSSELIAYCLHGLAELAAAEDQWQRAARLLAAGMRLWEALGSVVWPNRWQAHQALLERVKRELGPEAFAVVWAEGERMSVDHSAAVGRRQPNEESTLRNRRDVATDPDVARLTPREREVAALIANGMSSVRIAQELIISERTADAHADNIRTKLGLHSRAEIAAWATRHNLQAR